MYPRIYLFAGPATVTAVTFDGLKTVQSLGIGNRGKLLSDTFITRKKDGGRNTVPFQSAAENRFCPFMSDFLPEFLNIIFI